MILFQAFINMAMTMGLAPVVGIAHAVRVLRRDSLITNMLAVGILLNISIRRAKVIATAQGFSIRLTACG